MRLVKAISTNTIKKNKRGKTLTKNYGQIGSNFIKVCFKYFRHTSFMVIL